MISLRLVNALLALVCRVCCLFGAATGLACAQTECVTYALEYPAQGQTLSESKVVLRWQGDSQANYRLQAVFHQPEGRQLHSLDTTVAGNQWALSVPSNVSFVAVKALVSRNCAHYSIQNLLARPPSFFVNMPMACEIHKENLNQQGNVVKWVSFGPIDHYRVELHELRSETVGSLLGALPVPKVIAHAQTHQPVWSLPVSLGKTGASDSQYVVSVQASCGGRLGVAQALVLKP